MSEKEQVFLDTSIQIQRIFGYHLNRTFISKKLNDKDQFVSRYILMEYKRRVIRSFVLFYSCLSDENSVSEALNFFESEFSGRVKSDIIKIISKLLIDDEIAKDQALIRLERLIEWELLDYFESNIGYIPDSIECNVAKAETTSPINCSSYAKQLKCTKDNKQCNIDGFVQNHNTFLKSIVGSNKISKKLKTLCNKICNHPKEALGINCKILGDTIISIEAPNNSVVCSYDKAFAGICTAINKEYEIFPFHRKSIP